jgi:hypothetical protein
VKPGCSSQILALDPSGSGSRVKKAPDPDLESAMLAKIIIPPLNCTYPDPVSPFNLGLLYNNWILRIRMFLSLLDPDLLLFDQIRIWIYIRILPSTSKKSKKNLDFYKYLTSYLLFTFTCKCTSKN